MKVVKVTLFALLAALVAVGMSTTAYSFHSGGVAECEGCHTMHSPASTNYLLVGGDQSSTCLTCHEGPTLSSYHVSTTGTITQTAMPANMTPGGDFAWLKRTYTDGSYSEPGRTHGHNIVAADFGYVADDNLTTAPGGTFVSNQLACNSCHDPHGKYRRLQSGAIVTTGAPIMASGSYDNVTANEPTATAAVGVYRLLAGNLYSNKTSGTIGYPGVPAAKAPGTYNRSEAAQQTRVAYGVSTASGHATWSNWCATCHPGMHSTGHTVHPVDQGLGADIASFYNKYVKSGDMSGGAGATAFSSLTPFATNSGNYTVLAGLAKNDGSALGGPANSDQVMCLSCHRAHASGFVDMLRFDQGYEFMTKGGQYVGSDNPEVTGSRANVQRRGRNNAEWQRAYYERPASTFATYQRALCNKCHAKD